ncbi:aminoglycoside phosphotransferase [Streptomyces gobiensis]|uniref:aminoglycoside phosphotransferase n=1 Tax=Streptomyces gobiensis TaxID=2875706 RepID=UPI001E4D9110|nr:aminoglycoside phosphotransferase [Streptomyces gobiensis]UGY92257.1 aminoglycoside phosphotransferase [Streptomyces gobiensis]
MERTAWEVLPGAARQAVEAHTGTVKAADTASAGVMSHLACALYTEAGRFFVKGTWLDDAVAWMYRREAEVAHRAPLAPRPLWHVEAGGWLLCGYEYADGRHPDLSPRSPDIEQLLGALVTMSAVSWPESVNKKPLGKRWGAFLPGDRRSALEGRTLAHTDISALNMLITPDGLRMVDWALAAPAPAWADTAFTVLRLVHAGHTPDEAEALGRQVPAYCDAAPDAVTTFAEVVHAVWADRERADPLPHRAALTTAARDWAAYRASRAART